ncbi:hypothetical protein ACH5RR_016723 [Cinchona calisaya]|uniref:Uncharacterized protein n=1 Tax=Cinchona calisaya TaxID=153742 RepID=A0ABD2ZWS4_9GENT
MDSPSPESLHAIHKSVIGKLLKGKESATELHTLFQTLPEDGAGRVLAQEHVLIISRSFAESLSLLNSGRVNGTSQIVAVNSGVGVSSGDRSSKSSDHGRKKLKISIWNTMSMMIGCHSLFSIEGENPKGHIFCFKKKKLSSLI